jgi:hypothetical protein
MVAATALPALGLDAPSSLNERTELSSSSEAMAWAPQAKSRKHVRHLRVQPARVASLARPACGWSTSSCDRPYPLMLGIGF